ncbi:unnamed protein product [Medioppia subpectinata]|uniref:Uncharacterized protein n=1 Tax=Medioppia subpectinata TaxID=1979941 RepID=A0A7R9Q649_9ACAR|nr:unnamed protein product [Medioppia subpectinata]CAG2112894.1 unnamed protein product [Medioppia subpectinata]
MMSKNILHLISIAILCSNGIVDSVAMRRVWSAAEDSNCPTLYSNLRPITAIASIDGSPQLLLISGECAYFVDYPTRDGIDQRRHGFRHLMALQDIQDLFVIANNTNIEFVSLHASGTLVQIIGSNTTNATEDTILSNVFKGLTADLDLPIDAAFVWTSKRIAYIIQGSKYWAFELSDGWRRGSRALADNYPRSIADFGLTDGHKITTAFSDSTKIYFVSMDLVHEFHVSDVNPKTGRFVGSLCQKTIKLKDFLKCSKEDTKSQKKSLNWFSSFGRLMSDMTDWMSAMADWMFTFATPSAIVALIVIVIGLSLLVLTLVYPLNGNVVTCKGNTGTILNGSNVVMYY